ncbi:MAG: YicC family protein [Clostridia bacterium]|nr:YicC family protein [Clostridia bacterium]
MTGYGRAVATVGGKTITCEVKSVNQRYFDASVKLPRIYGYLEEPIKKRVQAEISRGKLDVYLTVDLSESENVEVTLNKPVLAAYLDSFESIERDFGVENDVKISDLIRLPDLFSVKKPEEDADQVKNEVFPVLEEALAGFSAFRTFEGEKMYRDILERIGVIRSYKEIVEKKNPLLAEAYRHRLEDRIRELLNGAAVDENRILTEAALYADKTAVAEETVRLDSHLDQLTDLIASDGPVGRKLDFLLQEMNREVNTTGSKINDTELTECVVNMKCELEKIREQIQNVE